MRAASAHARKLARRCEAVPRAVWIIAAAAVALRWLHAWLMRGDPLSEFPVIDPMASLESAAYLAEVSWLGPPYGYWKPPLYEYFLALHHALFGSALWPARISQSLLDGASCLLGFALAERLVSRGAGIAVAVLLAIWGPSIYFSSVHVSASLVIFLELVALLLAMRAQRAPSRASWLDAGVALGVLALARAESLLLAPWLAGWLWWSLRAHGARERASWVATFALAIALVIAPVALRNALYARDPVLISGNGGINLFIGTDPVYRGVVGVRPGPEWELLMRAPSDLGYETHAEQSAFYTRKALALIASDPARWIVHSARKLLHVWHGRELPSNRDLYVAREYSPVLAALLWRTPVAQFPFGLLAPLALIGMLVAWREQSRSRFLIGLVVAHCAALALFFVTGRFRLPMLPVLALFAAEAVTWAARAARAKRFRALGLASAGALALFALANCDALLRSDLDYYAPKLRAEEHYFRGTVLGSDMGRVDEGKAELEQALALEPDFVAVHYNLALLHEKGGDDAAALRLLREALAITERSSAERDAEPAIRGSLHQIAQRIERDAARPAALRGFAVGVGCLDRGDWNCAIRELRAAADQAAATGPAGATDPADPTDASGATEWGPVAPLLGLAHYERGRSSLRVGQNDDALADLSEAAALRPHDAFVHAELGVALMRADLPGRARSAFARFRSYDLPRGAYYRSALASEQAADRAIALAAARAIARLFPRDRLAREAAERLAE